jgi:hypothetical protein
MRCSATAINNKQFFQWVIALTSHFQYSGLERPFWKRVYFVEEGLQTVMLADQVTKWRYYSVVVYLDESWVDLHHHDLKNKSIRSG